MSQKNIITAGIFLAALTLIESWFLINIEPFGALIVVFILIIIFIFVLFFLSKIKDIEKKEVNFTNKLNKLESDYLKVQNQENKILAIIANFGDGILILDKDNKVDYINFQAEKILDIQSKDILKKSVLGFKNYPNFNLIVSSLLQDVKNSFKKEVEINKNLILEISINPLVIEKKYIGKFIVLHNITKGKIVEKIKTDVVSLVAHQLTMPLSAIKLSLKMLLDGSFGRLNKGQKDIIQKTYQRDKLLINFVNDLLDMAKIEEKAHSYNFRPVDIEDLIKSVIESNQEEIKGKKIKLKFEKPEIKFPKIILDKEKMFSAIKNIFDNAVKYTPVEGKITISLRGGKKELEFKIEDSGMGIPEYQKEKIFAKFFRASNAMKMEAMGSGLGLFIAKNIIEEHHGKIWFESKENEGSTFFFSLPIR